MGDLKFGIGTIKWTRKRLAQWQVLYVYWSLLLLYHYFLASYLLYLSFIWSPQMAKIFSASKLRCRLMGARSWSSQGSPRGTSSWSELDYSLARASLTLVCGNTTHDKPLRNTFPEMVDRGHNNAHTNAAFSRYNDTAHCLSVQIGRNEVSNTIHDKPLRNTFPEMVDCGHNNARTNAAFRCRRFYPSLTYSTLY